MRLKTTLQQLHETLANSGTEKLSGIKTGLESLLLERKALDEMPTWPWQPGTFRGLLTALLLPLLLLLIQQLLELWLGP